MLNKKNKIFKKMTEIRKSKFSILILLMLVLPLVLPLFSSVLNVNEDKNNYPKTSGFWVMGPLHIKNTGGGDYTWAQAASQPWCSGNGSLNDPFLLENITIDAGSANSGILIEESNNIFFTIRNCTLMNAGGTLDGNGGIKLMSTTNGTIINNKCLNNMKFGIILEDNSDFNLIQDNYLFNSTHAGIGMYQSSHNTIVNNNISDVGTNYSPDGFFISSNSEFNTISNNRIIDKLRGIILDSSTHNNTISDNYISGCSSLGIVVWAGGNNNTIKSNKVLQSGYGIGLVGDGNLVYLNNITGISNNNGDDSGHYNKWDNGTIGNYWDDYADVDGNDDGIGDSPYSLPGTAGTHDNFPIWDDGPEPIYINGAATGVGANNWSWAVNQPWCTGLGTLISPYIIEDITRDGKGNGFCISVENSAVYFEVRNCNLTNAGFTFPDAAILLNNVDYATIIGNDLTDNNFVGILMDNSDNNNLIGNNASLTDLGILMTNSEFNYVTSNTINDNIENAINIDDNSNFNIISGNTVINNQLGISIFSDSDNNTVIGNTAMENDWAGISCIAQSDSNFILDNHVSDNNIGVTIPTSNCRFNTVSNNTFTLNTLHADDEGSNNNWNLGTLGNYWDNYTGDDLDDNGIGDIPYNISGSAGSKDYYAIWDDGDDINPTISINSPSGGSLFGTDAPTYNLDIFDINLNMSWYTLNSTATRYFFTPTNGVNVVAIDETGWDSFSSGAIIMTFYVNDSNGNPASQGHVIFKDAILPAITVNSPLGGATFGLDAPVFNLTIFDLNLFGADYVITPSLIGDSFSPVNGINIVPIDESSWDALTEGSYTFTFSVSDTAGNVRVIQVIINKDLPSTGPEPGIPFGQYYLIFLGIGILALLIVQLKRRKYRFNNNF